MTGSVLFWKVIPRQQGSFLRSWDVEGHILSQSGWKDICTLFHRVNPQTAKNCRTSDTVLANKLNEGGKFNVYKCLNGLVDVAVPLIVDGQHLANLFTGQFFFEPPDLQKFKEQAERFHFDSSAYMKALSDVPVIKEEDIRSRLMFLLKMTELMAELGISKIKQIRINEDLDRSKKKYQNLFENMNEGFALNEIILDDNGIPIDYRILEINSRFTELTGLNSDQVIGHTAREIFSAKNEDPGDTITKLGTVALTGVDISYEEYIPSSDRWFLFHSFRPNPGQFAVSFTDITESKKAEEERERLMAAIEQSQDTIVILNLDGTIRYINPSFERVTGYTQAEALGKSFFFPGSDIPDEPLYQAIWETLKSGQSWSGRLINYRKDGKSYTEDVTISPVFSSAGEVINYASVKRDVTKEIKNEERLQKAEKMESIGSLAGGIAHDFNNILGGIIGYTDLTLNIVDIGSQVESNLQKILSAGIRGRELIGQIMSFSNQRSGEKTLESIQKIVTEAVELLRASLPDTIEILCRFEDGPKAVQVDSTRIHEIIMNICTNAAQAMSGLGTIEIAITEEFFDSEFDGSVGTSPPGLYSVISIKDSGKGMSKEVMKRVFDPFFTTKEVGEGTGLGLSVVFGILQDHNGNLIIESEPSLGTTMHIYLPKSELDRTESILDEVNLQHGSERIFFIDDEEILGEVAFSALTRLGYQVEVFSDSVHALQSIKSQMDSIDMIITDQNMPNMTGFELSKKILEIKQDLPIILCTGYSNLVDEQIAKDTGIQGFLMKPYRITDLASKIRLIFDE